MTTRTALCPPHWAWAQNLGFEQGIQIDNTIFVSGQAALDPDGNVVGIGDMRLQAEYTFQNIATVLATAGGSLNDVVKITAWLTDMADYGAYNEVRKIAFSERKPASSTVLSPQLVLPELRIEIEAIAVLHTAK